MSERRRPNITWIARGAGAFLGLLLILAVANRRDRVVGLNAPIQFDDFAFVVRDAKPDPTRGRYLVTLEVINKARRVDFRFERSSVMITDADGRWYRPVEPSGASPVVLKAGESHVEPLEFEVGRDLRRPRLLISFGPAGDFLETLLIGRKRVQLP